MSGKVERNDLNKKNLEYSSVNKFLILQLHHLRGSIRYVLVDNLEKWLSLWYTLCQNSLSNTVVLL